MRFRKLRIAWSVLWGLACVLLVVLWVRSYWNREGFQLANGNQFVSVELNAGVLRIRQIKPFGRNVPLHPYSWPRSIDDGIPRPFAHGTLGFGWSGFDNGMEVGVKCWWPVAIILALALTPWLRWSNRFSLRTLLIATTLVAVVLGLIVWATR
jgi:hypothetical protein